ncbi:MAG: VOC family protein [Acidisphaera sp.]|nr:VOC family protein [Acidisphaera sp.]
MPAPSGYATVTPYLIFADAEAAIAFCTAAFGATERMRLPSPGGRIGHAEICIGDSVIMLADEFPDRGARSPRTIGGTPVTIHLYVDDVDATVARAIAAGAQLTRPVENQFYGDRSGAVTDASGHVWHIATRVEEVPEEELRRRMAALHG